MVPVAVVDRVGRRPIHDRGTVDRRWPVDRCWCVDRCRSVDHSRRGRRRDDNRRAMLVVLRDDPADDRTDHGARDDRAGHVARLRDGHRGSTQSGQRRDADQGFAQPLSEKGSAMDNSMSGSGTASGMRPELLRAAQAMLVDYLGFSGKERLLITTDTAGDQAVVQAITAAAIASGGRPVVLTIPQLPFQGKLADPYLPAPLAGAAHQCDIWIDLTFPYIAGADLHDRAMKTGAIRYLLASDLSAEGMRRLFSGVDLDAYFALNAAFDAFMATAVGSEIRITTTHGTDVRYRLTKPAIPRPRQVQAPGMYLLPGAASMLPDIETVQGEIAIAQAEPVRPSN